MGAALAQGGRLDEAIRCFNEALRVDPKSVEAHFNLGVALARQNKTGEAIEHFSQVLKLRPDLETARHWMEVLKGQK
jgi:tetratricopeptide (TPR) repeat protein